MKTVSSRWANVARGLMLSFEILAAHRLRTLLSISGLLVGVSTVMVMVAIGRGAERGLLERLQAMGTNLVVVSAAPAPRVADRPRQVAVHTLLRAEDAAAIVEDSDVAVRAAPAVSRSAVLRWEGLNRTTAITGTTAEGLRIRNIRAAAGRLFDENDDSARSPVAVIGPAVARSLFPSVDPVGRIVRIGSLSFEIVGIANPRGIDPLGNDLDDFVAIPFETAMRRVLNIAYVHAIYVQARSSEELQALERDLRDFLRLRYVARTGIAEPFLIQNQVMMLRAERAAAAAMNRLIPAVSGIALLLGAVGILTIMLMSVRQRTREIGLRRALGASDRDIRTQFLLEAAMLGTAGGGAGVLVGLALSGLASIFGRWELIVPWDAALLGFGMSMLLGLVIGTLPAARAARLEPIAALRAA